MNERKPPLAKGLPVLGSALEMAQDPNEYLVRLYHELGPVYRIRALNREFVVLAGPEANTFLMKNADELLGSQELFGGLAEEMETDVLLVAMDGEPHRHLRRAMRPGYAREALLPHLDEVVRITEEFARSWKPGETVPLLPAIQRIVVEQLGTTLIGQPPGEYYEDIFVFMNTVLYASAMKIWPKFMLRTPRYLRAKRRVTELGKQIIAEHRQKGDESESIIIRDMLKTKHITGEPLPEQSLIISTIGPYFAGMDTVANTLTFLIYALLKNPQALERVTAEVDELFKDGIPDFKALKDAKALHGAAMETLRMYPVAAITPRTALKDFEFAGYCIEKGEEVMMAHGVAHYLPEFYPNPQIFDIDRFHEPRNEHKKPGAFAPYSLGAHTCLGAGMAEVQIMVTLGALLRTVKLELDPANPDVKIRMAPLPSAGRKYAIRVAGMRDAEPVRASG